MGIESPTTEITVNVTTAPITTVDIGQGSIGGFSFDATKMYHGTGTFNNTNTAVYFDNTGQFSLKDKLSFDGTTLNISGNLTVENTITADKIILDGQALNTLMSSTGAGATTISELTVSNDAFLQGGFEISASQDGVFLDNAKAKFGTGSDLQIYHDGSDSYILDNGTGSLKIDGSLQQFLIGGSEAMRIDTSSRLLVGKTSVGTNTVGVECRGDGLLVATRTGAVVSVINRKSSDGAAMQFRKNNSTVGSISVTGSATAYNTSSDYRLKENVTDMTGALSRVNQLKPKRFNFISDDTNTLVDGFLAHEVSSIVPEAITGIKDELETNDDGSNVLDEQGNTIPVYQGIDQSKLVPLLVKAIQEQQAHIESLQEQINNI